jgi:hypothetical protein
MLALFLGAGFSKWAVNLPIAKDLFDFDIEPWGPREHKKLKIIKSLKDKWDVVHPNELSEQFIADALQFPKNDKEIVLWYLTRRLSEPFIWKEFHAQRWRRHVLMIDEKRKFDVDGIKATREFFQQHRGSRMSGIITTNYDMIVEYALGTQEFNYGILNQVLTGRGPYPVSQWRNPVTLTGTIPLSKIHGSISWDENAYYTDGRRGLAGHALIVAPTLEKKVSESLRFVWELAKSILSKATRLLVFGFAFNLYDEVVINLLRVGGKNLKSILLIDIESKYERAKSIWPKANILSIQPPPEGNTEMRNWLQS